MGEVAGDLQQDDFPEESCISKLLFGASSSFFSFFFPPLTVSGVDVLNGLPADETSLVRSDILVLEEDSVDLNLYFRGLMSDAALGSLFSVTLIKLIITK